MTRIVKDSPGYSLAGDLPIPSAISVTSARWVPYKMETLRFRNGLINRESNPNYDLIDLLMASMAIPLVFPPVKIRDTTDFPEGTYLDGGVTEDRIPNEAVIQNAKQTGVEPERMVIVSRKSTPAENIGDELPYIGLKDSELPGKIGQHLLHYSKDSFIRKLTELQQEYPGLASRTYVYIPDFEGSFPLLNFDVMKDQYDTATAWARQNQPILLSEFLKRNQLQENALVRK